MTERMFDIALEGGSSQALMLAPEGGPHPGILFLTDIWGVRPANIAMARRLADKGFAVLMPNCFWRWSANRPNGFEPEDRSRMKERLGELFQSLTAEQQEQDGAAYVDAMLAQPEVRPGKAGVVGYCFTGQMALRVAAARPDAIAAAASFHGGWLATDAPQSPHLLLPRIKARLYFGHAENDTMMTAEQIAVLEQALRDWRGAFQSETYKGAEHGWTVPGRDVYNELQAERAFEREIELFETLKD